MGVGDWLRDKITPGFVKDINTALTPPPSAATPAPPAETKTPAPATKTPQQAAYEANQNYMNRNNPGYVPIPRAKGGPVKAGGAKMPMSGPMMKNVDNSGLKKESC